MTGRWRTAAWLLAVAALAIAHLIVIWQSLVAYRFWEDEAFNLTVPLNLLRGLGYTSDGTLSGSELTPFDPRISTGPVVLLPAVLPVGVALATGADLVIAARIVPVLFWVLLVAGLWLVGRRIGGRWAAVVSAATPLAFDGMLTGSPLQGPADLLGEVACAALLVWAVHVMHARPWLAGLLVGLAVQAKLIALLAVPAFAIAVFFAVRGASLPARVRRLLPAAVWTIVPTALFQLAALAALGVGGFGAYLRATIGFVRSGGQVPRDSTVTEKLTAASSAWFVPAPVAVTALALAALAFVLAVATARRDRALLPTVAERGGLWPPRALLLTAITAALGVGAYLAWWSTAAHLPVWVRHPSPGLLAFVPILSAFAVLSLRVLWAGGALSVRLGAAAASVGLVALVGTQASMHVAQSLAPSWESLDEQRRAASALDLREGEWYFGPWGQSVSVIVLGGAHVGLWDAPVSRGGTLVLHGSVIDSCGTPLRWGGSYVVCER